MAAQEAFPKKDRREIGFADMEGEFKMSNLILNQSKDHRLEGNRLRAVRSDIHQGNRKVGGRPTSEGENFEGAGLVLPS